MFINFNVLERILETTSLVSFYMHDIKFCTVQICSIVQDTVNRVFSSLC